MHNLVMNYNSESACGIFKQHIWKIILYLLFVFLNVTYGYDYNSSHNTHRYDAHIFCLYKIMLNNCLLEIPL